MGRSAWSSTPASVRSTTERRPGLQLHYIRPVPSQPPSGTVTFLFSDIANSTRLWEESPAEMASALQAHDVIVRGAIERHGGYVFATGGDGFGAAFSDCCERDRRGRRVPA